jgi:YVTN family beta-propeller protein
MCQERRIALAGAFFFSSMVLLNSRPAQAQPFAYVANSGSHNVTVINVKTAAVVGTVAVGIKPSAAAVTPDATRA